MKSKGSQSVAPKSPCPSLESLKGFLSGKLSDEEIDVIADHLPTCKQCEETLRSEDGQDTVALNLRQRDPFAGFRQETEFGDIQEAAGQQHRLLQKLPDRIGQFRLLEVIGSGGMGTVFRAIDEGIDCVVAVKVLTERLTRASTSIARFERERKAIGRLNHPNIVRARTGGEIDGHHYLVMDFVDGLSLSEIVWRTGRLKTMDACEVIRQTATGLHEAYEKGIVHRDIKPSNLMVEATSGRTIILDLGIATLRDELSDYHDLTASQDIMGTLDYLAPEQAANARAVDIRADIYSLGCTLFCLLAGQPPYADISNLFEKLAAHREQPIPEITEVCPDIDSELVDVINRCLAKRPDDRYQTPGDLAAAVAPFCQGSRLDSLCHGDEASPWQATGSRHPRRARNLPPIASVQTRKGRKLAFAIAGLVGFSIVAAIAMILTSERAKMPTARTPVVRQLDSVSPHVLNPLLCEAPVRIYWPDPDGQAIVQHNAELQQVSATQVGTGILAIGQTSSSNYSIRVNLSQAGWNGGIGVFWGHKQDLNGSKLPSHCFQCLKIRRRNQPGRDDSYELVRMQITIDPQSSLDRIDFRHSDVNPLPPECTLLITFRNAELSEVRLEGAPLDMLTDRSIMRDANSFVKSNFNATINHGMFGLLLDGCSGTFRDGQFRLLQDPF